MRRARASCVLCNTTDTLLADMITPTRRSTLLPSTYVFLAALLLSGAAAQESGTPFNCQPTLDGTTYDLTSLKGAQIVTRERDSPPSKFIDELRFDLCAELQPVEGRLSEDQVCAGRCSYATR